MQQPRPAFGVIFGCLTLGVIALTGLTVSAAPQVREFTISGEQYTFVPGRIDVQKDEIVKITFSAKDIPHSFTIDQYRISKRAGAGQTVTFEFRADQPGSFTYYCNLSQDEKCKGMRGQLVVK
jgi:heme/copper-type cytochrome/quinol oxidase subunit 2